MSVGKVFAILARKRLWASLRFQGETGESACGDCPWECIDGVCWEVLRICTLGVRAGVSKVLHLYFLPLDFLTVVSDRHCDRQK